MLRRLLLALAALHASTTTNSLARTEASARVGKLAFVTNAAGLSSALDGAAEHVHIAAHIDVAATVTFGEGAPPGTQTAFVERSRDIPALQVRLGEGSQKLRSITVGSLTRLFDWSAPCGFSTLERVVAGRTFVPPIFNIRLVVWARSKANFHVMLQVRPKCVWCKACRMARPS